MYVCGSVYMHTYVYIMMCILCFLRVRGRVALQDCIAAISAFFASTVPILLRFAEQASAADDTTAACEFHGTVVATFLARSHHTHDDVIVLHSSAAFVTTWYSPEQGGGAIDGKEIRVRR